MKRFLSFLFLCNSLLGFAQPRHWVDSVSVNTNLFALASSNESLNPLGLYSLKWGVVSPYDREVVAQVKADVRVANFRHFDLNVGLGLVGKSNLSSSMLHEAYASGRLWIFDYMAGLKAYSPLANLDLMTSGNYLMSSNARPTPKFGFGLFDYWAVPGTRNWLEIKGAFFLGRLFNERDKDDSYTSSYVNDVRLHEKFVYARVGHYRVKPYVGLVHSVLYGGTMANGVDLPRDFWSSFLGRGSSKFSGSVRGEATNAAGAHQGLWHGGFDLDFDDFSASVYLKKPFTDGSSNIFLLFNHRSYDGFVGTVVNLRNTRFVKSFGVEFVKTDWQGDEGMPDACGYDDYGKLHLIWPGDFPQDSKGRQNWFEAHFSSQTLDDFAAEFGSYPYQSEEATKRFFEHKWNHDKHYGGRDNMLSNGFYPQGWSAGGLMASSAYFLTQKTMDAFAADYTWQNNSSVPNYRIRGLVFSVDAVLSEKWSAFAKFAATCNYGNLLDKYTGCYSWEKTENYYFDRSRSQFYSLVSCSYAINNLFSVNCEFAADFGDMYKSLGGSLALRYRWARAF